MLNTLLFLAAANGLLAILMMLVWRQDFARQGRISPNAALLSGIVMHGHALLTFAVAWLDRGALGAPSLATSLAGGAIALLGALIILAGRYAYGSQRRVYGLMEDKLIEHGIYRWTRNPQYFGYWMMFIGAALASLSAWTFLMAIAFAVIVHIHITRVEEPHLKRQFGETYDTYCMRVARYFGRSRTHEAI